MKTRLTPIIVLTLAAMLSGAEAEESKVTEKNETKARTEEAILGGGCFWCVEAVFERIDGVHSAISGYMGGETPNPTYKMICTGMTGHAEVVKVVYDPDKVNFSRILDVFFTTHDPTTLNQQGADRGTQYRSVIFPRSEDQKKIAKSAIEKWNASGEYRNPIVTTIEDADTFYEAEVDHQDYFKLNPNAGYCRIVIAPKIRKLEAQLKKEKSEKK